MKWTVTDRTNFKGKVKGWRVAESFIPKNLRIECVWFITILSEQIYLFNLVNKRTIVLPKATWKLARISIIKNIEILMVIEKLRKITYHSRMPNLELTIGLWINFKNLVITPNPQVLPQCRFMTLIFRLRQRYWSYVILLFMFVRQCFKPFWI